MQSPVKTVAQVRLNHTLARQTQRHLPSCFLLSILFIYKTANAVLTNKKVF